MVIKGILKKDKKTKKLINRLNQGDIAMISHKDLDEIAVMSLIEAKVNCIINTKKTISGKYPNQGPKLLIKMGIPLFEVPEMVFDLIKENTLIEIKDSFIYIEEKPVVKCERIGRSKVEKLLELGAKNIEKELDQFIENTLEYAKREKDLVLGKIKMPKNKIRIQNKHVLIVVRGKDYKMDLMAIQSYIHEVNPILIGVDGGGDALLEFGYIPDIIIGDMDSVSDRCLRLSKEIIVHAYPNGKAPGLKRIKNLNLNNTVFAAPGTSEDIAMLMAYCNGADLIVAVGTHNNMIDFLEKGRKGMASTFLVRLKVGSKLVDAKGVNKLYKSHFKMKYLIVLCIAALIPIIIITFKAPQMEELMRLILIRLRMFFAT